MWRPTKSQYSALIARHVVAGSQNQGTVSPGTWCRWVMCTAQHPARSAGREAKPPTHLWNYPSTQATGSHRPAAMWRQHPHHQIGPRCRNNPPREITVAANVSCSKREEHEARVRMPGDDRMEFFDDQMTRPKFCFSRRHRHSHEITLQLPASASRRRSRRWTSILLSLPAP